jgi:hypothetical protein
VLDVIASCREACDVATRCFFEEIIGVVYIAGWCRRATLFARAYSSDVHNRGTRGNDKIYFMLVIKE